VTRGETGRSERKRGWEQPEEKEMCPEGRDNMRKVLRKKGETSSNEGKDQGKKNRERGSSS